MMSDKGDKPVAPEKVPVKELIKQDRIPEAIEMLEKLQKEGGLRKKELVQLGQLYLKTEKWERARDLFEDILQEDPCDMKVFAGIREAFAMLKDQEAEADFLEKLLLNRELKKKGVRSTILIRLREIYENSENVICLQKILEHLHVLDPWNKDLIFDLARTYIEMDRMDEPAAEIYEKAYRMAHELPDLEKQLVKTYRTLKKNRWRHLDICIQYYKNDQQDSDTLSYVASVLMDKDETVDDAIEMIYRDCIEKKLFTRGALLYHLGLFYEKRRKYAEAIESYDAAHEAGFGEQNHYPLKKLGLLCESRKDLPNARKYMVLHCEKYPGDEDGLKIGRRVLMAPEVRESLTVEELKLSRRLIEKDPSLKDYLFAATMLLEKHGEVGSALKCYQAAGKLDPSNIQVLASIKSCQVSQGSYRDAAETLENILSQKVKPEERTKYALELASICSSHLKEYDMALASLEQILRKDPSHYGAHREKIALYQKKGDHDGYYKSLMDAWHYHIQDEDLLKEIGQVFRDSKNAGAGAVLREIMVFLGIEKEEGNPHPIPALQLEDCVHQDEKKGKERLDSYKNLLQIKLNGSFGELQKLREFLEDMDLDADWKDARKETFAFLGEMDVQMYSCREEKFRIKVFQEKDDHIMVINVPQTVSLRKEVKTCLMASGYARLKLEHPRYHEYIRKINAVINQHIEKVIEYISSTVQCSSDYLMAPLFFLIRTLKQGKYRRALLEKILDHVESLKKYPVLLEMIKDLFKLVLLEEEEIREFVRGFSYSSDRVAYAVCKNLYHATCAILYDRQQDLALPEISRGEILKAMEDRGLRERIAQLWKFAIDIEMKKS